MKEQSLRLKTRTVDHSSGHSKIQHLMTIFLVIKFLQMQQHPNFTKQLKFSGETLKVQILKFKDTKWMSTVAIAQSQTYLLRLTFMKSP